MDYTKQITELLSLYNDEFVEKFEIEYNNKMNNIKIIYSELLLEETTKKENNRRDVYKVIVYYFINIKKQVEDYISNYGFTNFNVENIEMWDL
jgi:nucleoside-specific outer membrane channel protein Tsx